jgi:hypothetical protein
LAILNSGFGIPGRARNPQNPARDGNRCGGKGLGDKLRVSEMVGQFVEKRPHTRSDQVRCTCGRLAGELPGKCREGSGDGRAEGGRLGLMYVPPALSGGLSSPTQTPQYPTSRPSFRTGYGRSARRQRRNLSLVVVCLPPAPPSSPCNPSPS